jgi:hypothetical protein
MCNLGSTKYPCSYEGLKFKTMALLLAHVKKVHTGKFLPIKVTWD